MKEEEANASSLCEWRGYTQFCLIYSSVIVKSRKMYSYGEFYEDIWNIQFF